VTVKVAQVAAGNCHTVICTSEGRVWTFGCGSSGRLGHGGNANELAPRIVEGLVGVKVAQVASGDCHTVICTAEGRVWTLGMGVMVNLAMVVTLMRWFLELWRVWWV
jgi:alpha-tubulin suppressor-like RCC1 family protein